MEYEKSKQKYLDKLKKTSSKGLYKSTGILDIQNDNSLCFNESHKKYVEPKCAPNDLLEKVECYIRANPSSHVTKNRLTVKRGLDRRGPASNVQTRNNLDIVHKSNDVQDLENVISFIKPKRKLVDYKPETKIKFGPPDATSTIKHKQAQSNLISQKQILMQTAVTTNIKYEMSEKMQDSERSSSSKLTSSEIIISNMQAASSTLLDPEINKNQYNLDIVHKSSDVQDLENAISFIKPKRKLVDYKPETKIQFGPPDATSKIKHKQAQSDLISQKKILKQTAVTTNIKYEMSEKMQGSERFSSSKLTSSEIIISNMQATSSTLLDPEINKNKCISIEENSRLNLTYCLYLEFVHTHSDEIISIDKTIYPNNDYSVNLKKQLQLVQFQHQNQQDVKNKKLMDCTDRVNNDKSIYDFNNISSISSGSDFVFNPVINLFKSPDLCTSTLSRDSFVCSTQEISFTNSDNSMNVNSFKLEPNEDYFSSPEICSNESTNNTCEIKTNDYQSGLSFNKSLEESTQKSKHLLKSSSISSEDSFKYYRKKMF